MGIVRFALRFPHTFYVLALILFLGITAISAMPTDIFPEIRIPVVTVIWQYTGLSTPEMEQRVTTYSQYAISSNVNGIKDMEAQTLDGLSVQKIYFQPDVNLDLAISQIVSATNAIRSLMPSGVQPPIVVQFNASSVPVLQVSLSSDKRSTKIAQSAAAALRLLLFTWCRLREILHLRWEHVDVERSCLFLPDSKSGRKTVILNAPALAVLNGLERNGPYVVPGVDPEQPRHDLKRPWDAVTKRAGVTGVRLHDLRHTYANFGAGGGLGLPIIGRLLGHSQPATTARYAHLDNDPLRRASEAIAGRIATALEGKKTASVTALTKRRTA